MSEIKTISITTSESSITFDAFYPYVWFKNAGENDAYIANYAGIEAGAVDVALVKSGECAMITAQTDTVYAKGAGSTTLEVHAQGFAESPFKRSVKGGESISVTPLSVSVNGTYTAPTGTAYSPVVVDVVEQPWQPLEDGYSNFWFELTDDTLSPWLNFSAKNADATIDWGDGSGEQALDTLTPTHTYSKAGKYVVKVKGVTGIGRQFVSAIVPSAYMQILKNIEFNSEVTALAIAAFRYCVNVDNIAGEENIDTTNIYSLAYMTKLQSVTVNRSAVSAYELMNDFSLCDVNLLEGVTEIGAQAFYYCISLNTITLPSTLQSIGNTCFSGCSSLAEVHIRATTPPSLGTGSISGLPSDWICYVPTGTGETYKAAAGWSAYADHIVEEGQTLSKAALRRIQAAEKTIDESEVR